MPRAAACRTGGSGSSPRSPCCSRPSASTCSATRCGTPSIPAWSGSSRCVGGAGALPSPSPSRRPRRPAAAAGRGRAGDQVPDPSHRPGPLHALGYLEPGIRALLRRPSRPGPPHRRQDRHSGPAPAHPRAARPHQAAVGPVPELLRPALPGQPGRVLLHPPAGHHHHRQRDPGRHLAGGRSGRDLGGTGAERGHHRGPPTEERLGPQRHRLCPHRDLLPHLHPRPPAALPPLLHPHHPRDRHLPRPRQLHPLHPKPPPAGPRPDPALDNPRHDHRRHLCAAVTQLPPRDPGRGLRPDGPGQGAERAPGRLPPRPAQRPDADPHPVRHRPGRRPGRRHPHRERLRVARARLRGGPRHRCRGSPRDPGCGPGRRRLHNRRQHRGGRAVCCPRPQDPAHLDPPGLGSPLPVRLRRPGQRQALPPQRPPPSCRPSRGRPPAGHRRGVVLHRDVYHPVGGYRTAFGEVHWAAHELGTGAGLCWLERVAVSIGWVDYRSILLPDKEGGMTSSKSTLEGAVGALRRPRLVVIGLSMLAVLAAACGSGSGSSGQSTALASKQVLKFPIYADPATMDPALGDQEIESELSQNVFDNLWLFDNKLNIVPDLATAVPTQANGGISADGLTYTIHLNPKAKFSNGDPVTSKDVLYSWNRAVALHGAYSSILSAVQGYSDVQKAAGSPPSSGTPTTFQANIEKQLAAGNSSFMMSGLTATDPETVQIKLSKIEKQLAAGNSSFMMSGLTATDPETVQIKLS